jgi:hypothetical protein
MIGDMIRVAVFLFLVHLALLIAAVADCLGGERPPRPGGGAGGGPRRPRGPVAPDDDPDFLRDLDRKLRDDERRED